MISLEMRRSGRPESHNQPWELVWRTHNLGGTDYENICYFTDEGARAFMEEVNAHKVSWLHGEPDWDERYKARQLEHARVLRVQAEKIEKENT